MNSKKVEVLSNVLEKKDFEYFKQYMMSFIDSRDIGFDEFGRKCVGENSVELLRDYSIKLLPLARRFFNSETLVPSYTLFTEYCNDSISLDKHKDANACTYTIDLALYQSKPWPLFVENDKYMAEENEAIMFWGEDQLHWREPIENNQDRIGVVFFHYVEPDHWWFTEGPQYVEVMRERLRNSIM